MRLFNKDFAVKSRHSRAGGNPGVCNPSKMLDPGLRRDDRKGLFSTFYEANNKGRLNNSGFTVTELIVIIAIIGILTAIAIPAFSGWIPTYRLKQAARDLYSTLQARKMMAVKNNQATDIGFSTTPHQYQYDNVVSGVTQTVVVALSSYGSGVRFQNNDNSQTFTSPPSSTLRFNGRGGIDATTNFDVFLSNANNTAYYCVRMAPSGSISLLEYDGANYK